MRARLLELLILTLLLAVSTPLHAKKFASAETGVTFEIPDNWDVLKNTAAVVMASSVDRNKSFVVFVSPAPDFYALSEADGVDFEKGLVAQGWTIDKRDMTQIDGVPFYAVRGTQPDMKSGGALHAWNAMGFANHKAYAFGGMKLNDDPTQDDEIMTAIRSFHFTGSPEVSTAVRPIPWESRSLAYKLGYWAGRAAKEPLAWAVLVALIIGVELFIRRLRKPKPARQYGRRGKARRWFD